MTGSPPHVRVILSDEYDKALEDRITPACAGNTRKSLSSKRQREDHPRMCG